MPPVGVDPCFPYSGMEDQVHPLGSGPDNKLLVLGPHELGEPLQLLECSPDAMAILGGDRQQLLAANLLFIQLLGLDLDQRDDEEGHRLLNCLHPDDHHRFLQCLMDEREESAAIDVRLIGRDNDVIPVSACARRLAVQDGQLRWVAFFREVESVRQLEKQLQAEIEQQKRRTVEAVKSSLRIYQLTEKMRATPRLSTFLLEVQSEDDLYARASEFLRSDGLNYVEVAFLLLEGNTLKLRSSTGERMAHKYDLRELNKYALFLQRGEQPVGEDDTCLVKIRAKDRVLGVLEVIMDSRERMFFNENRLIERWHQDILETIAEMLGLALENIRLYEELRQQSVMDGLTGTYNRHFLVTQLEKEIERTARHGRPLSLIFVDVDGFKGVNDLHGHAQGDAVLREISAVLLDAMRSTDYVCRYGGDEFVIILPETDLSAAEAKAERLRSRIDTLEFTPVDARARRGDIRVSVSLGLASSSGKSAKEILQVADMALYGAKRQGKNCVFHMAGSGAA